jgi:hypothetical protein
MFKKIFSVIVISGFVTSSLAAKGDQSTGCGLGWKVNSRMSLSGTSTRGTTNSVSGGAFGTTSGTSGCDQYSIVKKDSEVIHFTEANYEFLLRESAVGYGEALDGLATTLNCESGVLGSTLKAHYGSLIVQPNAMMFLQQVKSLSQSSPALSHCMSLNNI